MTERKLRAIGLCIALLASAGAHAQEALSTVLDRGYVAHWMVCGPFIPDADGGLLKAVADGRAPLGQEDFMGPRGGATKIRPQHLDIIETEQGDAVWQRAGATDYTLDLSPFYPSAREGITYTGFYARSDTDRTVYVDLQTPLGARVWLNGYLLRDVRAVPLNAAGRDQFLAPFRSGENFMMIETPGAAFEELAKALGMTERELSARGLVSRPLLQGRSGFEIALRLRAAQPLGTGENAVAVVSKLASEGTYSGQASAPRQDYSLTVFNNGAAPTAPLSATIRYSSVEVPMYAAIGVVAGKAAKDTRVSVPLAKLPEGQGLPLEITVTDGTLTTTFSQTIQRDTSIEPGKVYVLTGPHWLAADKKWPPEPAWVEGFTRESLQAANDANYGFVLGPEAAWEAALLARPTSLAGTRKLVGPGQCAAESAYAPVDPCLLSPALLYRNLVFGHAAAKNVLNDAAPTYVPWQDGGLPQQLPQLLSLIDLPGAITGVDTRGVPELSQWLGPDGTPLWLRRKEPVRGPLGLVELRQMATLQRRELLARSIKTDVLVDQAATTPPEPFFSGQAEELARSVPSIIIRGGGAQAFFEDLRATEQTKLDALPRMAWPMDDSAPARIREADAVWLAHFHAQSLLDSAQRLGSFAAIYGWEYPAANLAKAERALLYLAGYAMSAASEEAFTDALSETRQAAAFASDALKDATAFLASQVDTLKGAPLDTKGVRALIVFNPSSWTRTDLVSAEVLIPAQSTVHVVDDEHKDVTAIFGAPQVVDAKSRTVGIAFTAKDVPGIGHRTYYLVPTLETPKPEQRPDLLIENEYFELSLDHATGDIERITEKESGESLLTGPGNSMALLPEVPGKRKTADGLWTEGEPVRPTGHPEFRTTITPALQEISVRTAFAGGSLVRVVRLYSGLRRVEFESRIEGGKTDGLVTTSFSMGTPQHVTVSGTPFGASVRAESDNDLEYRTGNGAGLHPALFWTARAPGEQVQVGTEGGIPLLPTIIIHGAATPLRDAAQTLAAALASRGVPVKVMPADIQKPDFLWSDSTDFESHDDEWAHGMRLRFVLGSPEQNSFCSEVVKGQSPETIKWLSDRAPQGVTAFVSDARAKEAPPVPTFLFMGATANRSAELIPQIAKEITSRGTFTLPASSFIPRDIPHSPERGMALVFEGSANVCTDSGGATVLVLAQGSAGDALRHHAPAWRYALAPTDGQWTSGEAPQLGHAYNAPFSAATTDLHAGRMPERATYLTLDVPGAVVTSVHPANNGTGRDGLVVQAYDPSPIKRAGKLRCILPLRLAATATFDEISDDALKVEDNAATVALPGFGIRQWFLMTGNPPGRIDAPLPPAPRGEMNRGATLCKYWEHQTAPGFAGSPLVSLAIEGTLNEAAASVRVKVGTIGATSDIEGIVMLNASEGLAVSPTQMYVHLAPGESIERDIALLWSGPPQAGSGIAATFRLGNESYRDVIEYQPGPLKVEPVRTGGKIVVRVTNPNAFAAEGFADCVLSSAYWPEFGGTSASRLTPKRQLLSVPAYETVELNFVLSDPDASPPMRIKVAANGHVVYANLKAAAPTPPSPTPGAAPPAKAPPAVAPPPPRAAAPVVERGPNP